MDEPESKEKAILTAGIHEFAQKGFDRASTNRIAKSAGVSKGLVFHYYESKEKLFEAGVDYALKFSMKELDFTQWDWSGDVIEKLKGYCEQELLFCKKYPDIYQFMVIAFTRPPEKISDRMTNLFASLQAMAPQFMKRIIDGYELMDDVDEEVLLDLLLAVYNFYSSKSMAFMKLHPKATIDELKPIIDRLMDMLSMSLRGLVKNKSEMKKDRAHLIDGSTVQKK